MTAQALIDALRARDDCVWADVERLRFSTPSGVAESEVSGLLRQHKAEILDFLRGPAEVSFGQQRLWILNQLSPGGAAYNMAVALELRGALDVEALERALGALVNRHESLRTVFVNVEGEPRQRVVDPAPWTLPLADVGAAARNQLTDQLREESSRGFDLAHGPLFRARLYRAAADAHVLLIGMHHIVSDGWSIGILFRELAALYGGFVRGEPPALPALRVQYRDFARWQRSALQRDVLESQLAHWRARLAGAATLLELPTDRARPAVESHRGAFYPAELPRDLVEQLQGLSRREGATLFMTLVSAFAVVLARYSGQHDLLIGTPVANRNRSETEDLVGFFVNTLVLRADLSGDPSARAFLGRMREACLDAFAHQDLPFERLVEALHPVRDLSRNAVFQVMFALQNTPPAPMALPGLRISPVELDTGAAQFDLSLLTWEKPEGLGAVFSYATDLFDESTIARLARHWRVLLEAMVAAPERTVSALPLLSEAERERLLIGWNATARDYGDARLPGLVEAQVARTPEAVAVALDGQTWTYAEVNGRANQLARVLRARGVGPDVLVGVCAERSVELVVALLAVLKAGGAYVPLDPAYPAERLAHMLDDAQVRLVLAQPELRDVLPAGAGDVLALDPSGAAYAHESPANLPAVGTPDDLAYVIFTSGSTGRPKGAMNAHRGIANRLQWMQETYGLTPADRVLQKTPSSFDVSVWEFFWPLMTGAPLVLARPEGHKDPRYLVDLIQAAGITTLHFVPSMLRVFLDEPGVEACTSLVRIICSGEALPPELQARVFARLPEVALHNLYGPTEAAVDVTHWACRRGDNRLTVPIGRPVANTQMYVLDGRMQPVPIGVAGELYIGGVQVGRGYVGRPDLTAERFVPDPFASTPGARLYRTGDRARYLADGAIEYLGRLDYQVKIRGQRIELGEIEAVLDAHPAVSQSVVLAREDVPGDQRLVAYVVAQPAAPTAAALTDHLARQVPPYMVPGSVVFLDALPLTASGKVDRKALPAPERRAADTAVPVAPRTPTEQVLASIWADVLGLERIGVDDNFFDLGGHSLLATQVVSRVRQAFAIELPLRALFTSPTIAGMSACVEAQQSEGAPAACVPPLLASSEGGAALLSFAQQRLWMLDQIAPNGAAYVIRSALELDGPLDVAALERAVEALVARHDALRTVFVSVDGEPKQDVAEPGPWTLPMSDASRQADARGQIDMWLRDEASRGFELARGPLFRAHLYRESASRHVLLLAMHHIISDGWSLGVVARELSVLYRGFAQGNGAALPALPVTYRDFARWQRGWLQGAPLDAQLSHWRTRLAGAPVVLELPTDRPRPQVESHRGALHLLTLPHDVVDRLRALSRHEGTTLFMTLLSGFALLLARYTRQDDLLIGTPVANRNRLELEGLVGFFVNTLALRADLTGGPSVREVLARLREVCLDAYAHQDVPFERLVEELQSTRDLSRNAVVQVMFALQNAPAEPLDLAGLALKPFELAAPAAQFDMSLLAWETSEGLSAAFSYATDLFDDSTIARMGTHWRALLEAMAATPDCAVTELPMLAGAERQAIVSTWNQTAAVYPPARCVHEMVAEQARLRPGALALEGAGGRLTYGELDERADVLANRLHALGAAANKRVAVYLERSLDMATGLLAVLKTGAAYVPIDPDYPAERVRFMLEDSESIAVLSQRSLAAALGQPAAAMLLVDADVPRNERRPARADGAAMSSDLPAYVIYTSGSTGQPKGVPITHANLFNLVCWHQETYAVTPSDRATQIAGPAFDASVWELWPYLTAGASVHLPDEATRVDPPGLVRWLVAQRITLSFLPTPLAEAAIREPWPADGALRVMLTGGDRLTQRPGPDIPFRLVNHYGPTENTVVSTCAEVGAVDGRIAPPIGRPLSNTRAYVVDAQLQPVPVGVPGELLVGGAQLAAGYWNRPELTAQKFIPDPFTGASGARVYRTGDLVRYLPDGNIEFLGRLDQQVKIRGFRVELGEIEAVIARYAAVREVAVVAREDAPGDKRLVAYVVAANAPGDLAEALRAHIRATLPEHMVPARIVALEALPLTPNGKVDRGALPAPQETRQAASDLVVPRSDLERRIAEVWRDVLAVEAVGVTDNFFDLGGHSLLLVKAHARLRTELGRDLHVIDLFTYPTVEALARFLGRDERTVTDVETSAAARVSRRVSLRPEPVAIIGMGGRFPGAADIDAFWALLREGTEAIAFFAEDEMRESGMPEQLLRDPNYVGARGYLDGADMFDAAYFGYSARDAELLDPQHRVLLECAVETLERAGYDADRYDGLIGVYAGSSMTTYGASSWDGADTGGLSAVLGTRPDFLTTRISYKLNLRGPSVNVQTACSTSLVAVHQACKALRDHECDIALAGGVSVTVPLKAGYVYVEAGIGSSDGHCRPFDAAASGTVAGNGVALVALKRLSEAVADGDHIHAIIRGTAINNDGAAKVGYTAPSVDGQALAIAAAQADAGVDRDTIEYVETHGTATALGDPIEVSALTRAFGDGRQRRAPCRLGAVKSNIGHLDAAAGVAGLIKASLVLEHREFVPTVHFTSPNPEIDFAAGPFTVAAQRQPWDSAEGAVRRAGVSSFGIGGTNAHAVLEQAPPPRPAGPSREWQLLCVSARTAAALDTAKSNLASHLRAHPDLSLADAAYTLQVGRRELPHRCVVVCRDAATTASALEGGTAGRIASGVHMGGSRSVVFMFSGQGAQYPNMAAGLYRTEPVFREAVDWCADRIASRLELDLREVLFPADGELERAAERLRNTAITQPALFVIEHALAKLWMSCGIAPAAMIGHSIGEYVAACLAGVMSLDDALDLVVERGRLMAALPRGSMLAVPAAEEDVAAMLTEGLSVASVNTPGLCVVSGPDSGVAALEAQLIARGLMPRRLRTSHAFHSSMMDPMLDAFTERVRQVTLRPPQLEYVSNLTGDWITPEQATDPSYYAAHLRQPVQFSKGVERLCTDASRVFLEVGPGNTLAGLARRHPARKTEHACVASMRHPDGPRADEAVLLDAVGQLWLAGVRPVWSAVHGGLRRRVLLPTYPFERKRYWLEPSRALPGQKRIQRTAEPANWMHAPSWRRSPVPSADGGKRGGNWLLLADGHGLGAQLEAELVAGGSRVAVVAAGSGFSETRPGRYTVNPADRADYGRLAAALTATSFPPDHVVHLWLVDRDEDLRQDAAFVTRCQDRGFFSVVHLAQALEAAGLNGPLGLAVLTTHTQEVDGTEAVSPEKAMVLGPCKVIGMEYPHVLARSIDVSLQGDLPWLARALAADLGAPWTDPVVSYRGRHRWVQAFEQMRLDAPAGRPPTLRDAGVYLVTGGLGRVGLEIAGYLARTVRARLALVSRTGLPARDAWTRWLDEHEESDATSRRIRRVQAMESAGAAVLVCSADVADEHQMRGVIADIEAHFGPLHGVMHAAGAERHQVPMRSLGRSEFEDQFGPKIGGLRALESVLDGKRLDFCIVHSSLASAMGVMDFASYTAAHLFMDAFVQRHNRQPGVPWRTINWDYWSDGAPGAEHAKAERFEFFMRADEGAEALSRILSVPEATQVLVSTGDLQGRIDQWIRRETPRAHEMEATEASAPVHARPALSTDYEAPRSDGERVLARIWGAMFGIDQVGIRDNFFELGGDSLLNIQIAARASQAGLRVTPKQIFEHQTIAALAAAAAMPAAVGAAHLTTPAAADIAGSEQGPVSESDLAEIWRQLGPQAKVDR